MILIVYSIVSTPFLLDRSRRRCIGRLVTRFRCVNFTCLANVAFACYCLLTRKAPLFFFLSSVMMIYASLIERRDGRIDDSLMMIYREG